MNWIEQWKGAHWHPVHRRPLEIPERFLDAHPDGLPNDLARQVVKRYMREFEQHALVGVAPVFFGRARTYKTYAACVIARYVYHKVGIDVDFVDCGSMFPHLEARRFDSTTTDYLDRLVTAPFVILDDIQNVRSGSYAADMMVSIASLRFNTVRPTIFTGNLDISASGGLKQVAELYGPAFARRLYDGPTDAFRIFT